MTIHIFTLKIIYNKHENNIKHSDYSDKKLKRYYRMKVDYESRLTKLENEKLFGINEIQRLTLKLVFYTAIIVSIMLLIQIFILYFK